MYLRVTKRRNADGTEVRYYQLAENTWDAERGCAVAKVVYNFGRADQLDADQLRRLAGSILRVVSPDAVSGGPAPAGGADDLRIRDSWTDGGVQVLEERGKAVGIGTGLPARAKRAGTKQPCERAGFAMAAYRALTQCSKLDCW